MKNKLIVNTVLIIIATIAFISTAFASTFETKTLRDMYIHYIESQEEERETEKAIIAVLDSIRIDTKQLQEEINLSQQHMEEATGILVEASNQAFIANQAFIQWAIENGFIQEVSE